MSYWENRSVQQIYEAMKDAESIADQMSRTYMKASVWLNEQGRDIFERFRKKWDLSEEEARKLIEAAGNGATAQQLVQTYMASGGKDKTLIREMESYAFRARLERLADISLQLDRIMQNVYQQEVKKTTEFYKSLADDQYYKTIFNLQQRAGYGFSFSHVSEKQIDRMLQMKWYGQNYSQRIWKNTRGLTEDLKTEMLVSLITGRTDRETAEIFNRKYGAGAIKSRRLIRTEAAWVSSQMVLAGYKDAKIKEYMYLATLDLRTSQMCRDMDGKIFPVEEYTIGKTAPPLHPWCRSTTIAVIHREWLADMKRTAKDANGKVIRIPANMTYQEWYDTYIKDNPAGQVEEKKIKNRSSDRQQHEKYRRILGDKVPESFVRFQEMKYNDPEKWEYTKELAKYIEQYPESKKRYFDIQYDLKKVGIQQGIVLPPKTERAYILPEGKRDPYHIMHRMLERGITDDDVHGYMADAKCMFVQWGGKRHVFYGDNGVAVITKADESWVYKTVWSKNDFDETTEKIMEVINKHVR